MTPVLAACVDVTVVVVTRLFALHDARACASTVPVTLRTMVGFCVASTVVVVVAVPFTTPAAAVLTARFTVVADGASAAVIACVPVNPVEPVTVAVSASTAIGLTTLAELDTAIATGTTAPTMTVPKVVGAVTVMIGGTWKSEITGM